MWKRIVRAIVAAVVVAAAPAWAEEVRTNPKLFQVGDSGAVVVIEGTWRIVTGRPSVEIPHVNSVRVECHRAARQCVEYAAKLIGPSDDASGFVKRSTLFLMREEFRVLEWSQDVIVARAEPRAADVELRISLVDRTAERMSRETAARGAQGANPTGLNVWRLE